MTSEEIQQAINRLEDFVLKTFQFNEAKAYAFELLEVQTIQEDAESMAKVYSNLGVAFQNLSNYPKALEYAEKALQINEEIGNTVDVTVNFGNIGNVYFFLSNYPKALEYYEKALYNNEKVRNKKGIATILGNIGIVYRNLSDYPKALEYYEKALHIDEEIVNKEGIARHIGNIGLIYQLLSDYHKSLEYYEKALQINEQMGKKNGIVSNFGNIGIVYKELLDYPKAIEYFEKALHIAEEIGNKIDIASNITNIGIVYTLLANYPKALKYVNTAYEISIEIGVKAKIMHLLNVYSELFEKMGDIDSAYSYYKQYIALKDEIQSEEILKIAFQFDQRRIIEEDRKVHELKLARFQEQERIFHNIFPIPIANRLIKGEITIADSFDNVSIFFSDIVGFTALSSLVEPTKIVRVLNQIFTAFDRIATKYGLEKIKTIGDAYMAVCGVPEQFEDHQYRTAQFAVEVSSLLKTLKLSDEFNNLQIRIGLHFGSVVAGIIGEKKFAYDVWGDAVNIASRLESHSEPSKIHISEEFATSISNYPEFTIIPRGKITIKGKGTMNTFWLEKGQ